jgi:hypothetical protein
MEVIFSVSFPFVFHNFCFLSESNGVLSSVWLVNDDCRDVLSVDSILTTTVLFKPLISTWYE